MKDLKTIPLLLALVVGLVGLGNAQTSADSVVTYTASDKSSMTISGTSTVHDWEADVKTFKTTLKLLPAAAEVQTPKADHYKGVTLQVPVKEIESGKGGMNNKIYGALKEEDHPNITFALDEVTNISSSTEDTTFTLSLSGSLTVAGNTRDITINNVKGVQHAGGVYQYTGSTSMKMTDFDVEPPSAMFGAIKAGDKITVSFDVFMKADNQKTAAK